MKIILHLIFFTIYLTKCLAQKPTLDYRTCSNFPEIISRQISNNGKYVLYVVDMKKLGSSLHICSTEGNIKKEIYGPTGAFLDACFTADSRRIISTKPGDTLCIIELNSSRELYIPQCQSFRIPESGDGDWLAYQLESKDLVLYNFSAGELKRYPTTNDYLFDKNGTVLLVKKEHDIDTNKTNELQCVDLINRKKVTIWEGADVSGFVFDHANSKVAFVATNRINGTMENAIWYYQLGLDCAHLWVNSQTLGMEKGFDIRNYGLIFSVDGQKLFFKIYQKPVARVSNSEIASVDIWSYTDEHLQSEQTADLEISNNRSFNAVVDLYDNKVVRLEQKEDRMSFNLPKLNSGGDDNYLLSETKVNSWEGYRLSSERPDLYLINTDDGCRKCIKKQLLNSGCYFSSGGKYVYWYDLEKRAYFTYNIQSGITRNISVQMNLPVYNELWDQQAPPIPYGMGPAIWLENDKAILIYDRYDIWQLDPEAKTPPVNITNGYGRKTMTELRFVYLDGRYALNHPSLKSGETVYLCGFDEKTKYNGFFKKNIGDSGDPVELIMSPDVYYFSESVSFVDFPTNLEKAKQANVFLLERMSATQFPNLQITRDFAEFIPVSELGPQKKYNWLTSELVRWRTFDGRPGEGILYKPENFERHKKYPIIFYVYERQSDGLNKFINPELSNGPMNIPFFVSQGYLVFCPDIHYNVGAPGESAYNYVVSAANMMAQKEWVDRNRMGIQGHSFGGYEVNYLITRTKFFAAAASAAGPSDWVSYSGTLKLNTLDAHSFVEYQQPRLGVSLWQNPHAYLKNSPLFEADKITTPLLIMHNKQDHGVAWSQGLELFTALRRLGKTSWMLQYDNGGHQLIDDKDKLDYSIRLSQFFDHYLKGQPATKWMTRGIPASEKGISGGFELSSSDTVRY